jgi:hypothetical protein
MNAQVILIMAGTTREYTAARQKLDLDPPQASWLTRPANLKDLFRPKVYRYGSWKALPRLDEIEEKLQEVNAVVEDLS